MGTERHRAVALGQETEGWMSAASCAGRVVDDGTTTTAPMSCAWPRRLDGVFLHGRALRCSSGVSHCRPASHDRPTNGLALANRVRSSWLGWLHVRLLPSPLQEDDGEFFFFWYDVIDDEELTRIDGEFSFFSLKEEKKKGHRCAARSTATACDALLLCLCIIQLVCVGAQPGTANPPTVLCWTHLSCRYPPPVLSAVPRMHVHPRKLFLSFFFSY